MKKYRAWNKKRNQMFGVRILDFVKYGGEKQNGICELYHLKGKLKGSITSARFYDLIFLQYTGFTDIYNKEIYEGDRTKNCQSDENVVFWDELSGSWRYSCHHASSLPLCDTYHEVIGNIYEK